MEKTRCHVSSKVTKKYHRKKVQQLRIEKKMTQQELSAELETMAIYICRGISRIEVQSRTITDIELYGLSQVLSAPIEELFKIS